MLSRRARVTTSLFNEAITSRNIVSTPYATLRVLPHGSARCAIVVSKKVAKSAVVRNRIKRQVSHILRAIKLPTAIILIFIKPSYIGADRAQIVKSFTDIVPKIKV